MNKISNNHYLKIIMNKVHLIKMMRIKIQKKIVIQIKDLIKIALKKMTQKNHLQIKYCHRISLSSKCNLDKGEVLK
jgi:hypothetical protein